MSQQMFLTKVSSDPFKDALIHFALRKVSYSPNKIVAEIQRDDNNDFDGFTAEQILNGSATSFVGSNNGGIKDWYDLITNNTVSQNNINKQPKIITNGSLNLENGKPTMIFDGIDDSLINNINYSSINQPFSFVIVYKIISANNFGYLFNFGINARVQQEGTQQAMRFQFGNNFIANYNIYNQNITYANINGASSLIDTNDIQLIGNPGTNGIGSQLEFGSLANSLYGNTSIQEFAMFENSTINIKEKIKLILNNYYTAY